MSRIAAASAAQREVAPRRHSKSGQRRNMKLTNGELDELVTIASALVPTPDVRKYSFDAETLSTAAPSSAEQSPELNCLVSEWPSLRQAHEDWDFCSEGSDTEELWMDLPEPALPINQDYTEPETPKTKATWVIVPGSDATEQALPKTSDSAEASPKLSFVDVLRERANSKCQRDMLWQAAKKSQEVSPKPQSGGAAMPAIRARPLQRRSGLAAEAADTKDETLLDNEADQSEKDIRQHGWLREHKASRNTKLQRKVANREERRITQSCKSRGWPEEDKDASEVQ